MLLVSEQLPLLVLLLPVCIGKEQQQGKIGYLMDWWISVKCTLLWPVHLLVDLGGLNTLANTMFASYSITIVTFTC